MNDGKGYLKKQIKLHTLPIDMQTHAMTKMKVMLPGAGIDTDMERMETCLLQRWMIDI